MADPDDNVGPFESTPSQQRARLDREAQKTIRAHTSPEGIVTILFTDIVESSRFRQRLGDAAAQERLREHNAVVREQIRAHGGFEVKAQGDGFMVAFSDAVAALACAVDIQKAVAEDNERHPTEALRVRMGINCGQVIKEEEDFFGGVVIAAARICSMAKGDQILVSEAVRVLAGLPRGIGYVRYGRRRLKGLAHSYDIWYVPWSGAEPHGFAKLRMSARVRVAAVFVLLFAVAGAGAGGVALVRAGGGANVAVSGAPQQLSISYKGQSFARIVEGDCKTGDLVIRGTVSGEVTGQLSGRVTGSGEVIAYVADGCQAGYSRTEIELTDADESSIRGVLEGPLNAITMFEASSDVPTKAGYGTSVFTITGGTGLYEGAIGTATCNGVLSGEFQPDGTVLAETEGDCKGQITTQANRVIAPDPLVVQLAATPLKVAVSDNAIDPSSTVGLAVVYGNTRDTTQSGLTLTLREPQGVRILTSALGEPRDGSDGERVWHLPDVAPGELKRFEFRLRILSAGGAAVPLSAEIDGDGFDHPLSSNVVTIDVSG